MPFEPGQSGNPNGRPTKEAQALKSMTKTEVDAVLRKLKRAAPEAVSMIIAAMSSTAIPEKDRLKYAKDALDMFFKVVALDNNLKKGQDGAQDEPADEAPQKVVLKFKTV